MKPETLLALRYLRSRKRTGLLSFLSITSIVGIMLGVATLIIVVSVMSGFSDNLKDKLVGANSDIVITRFDNLPIDNYTSLRDRISDFNGVSAVSPFIAGQVLLSTDKTVTGSVIKGIDPLHESKVSRLASFMISGELSDLSKGFGNEEKTPGILLGRDLALSLGVSLGSELTIVSPYGSRGPFGITPKMKKFFVAGLFDTGIYEYNATMAYISVPAAQDFFNMKESVSGFAVSAVDKTNLENLTKELAKDLGFPYWVRDWLSMNASLFSALKLEQFAMFVILTLIIVVASFNIISMIAITVRDKIKDIAILQAGGAGSRFIMSVFMRQGLIVGFVGTVLGDILALIISLCLKHFKIIELPKDIYFMDKIPVNIDWQVYLLVTVCSVAITFIAAVFPARQAAKMSPIEALRND